MLLEAQISPVATPVPPPSGALGAIIFGDEAGVARTEYGATLRAPMASPGRGLIEAWFTGAGRLETLCETPDLIALRRGDAAMVAGQIPCEEHDVAGATERAYARLFALFADLPELKPIRIWNFAPRINAPDPSGLERYRAFCLGRARAFEAAPAGAFSACAATGIGCLGGPIAFAVLAAPPGLRVENPLQVPADEYPTQYGPKPPIFARATWAAGRLLVSGTAAILGHESVRAADLRGQTELALENVRALIADDNLARFGVPAQGLRLSSMRGAKLYVRHAQDMAPARAAALEAIGAETDIAVFNVDICRKELLVEIECWF